MRKIILSTDAQIDIVDLKNHIKQKLKAPQTAADYIRDLKAEVKKLAVYGDIFGVNEFIQTKFGNNARHITFKKMTIIYIVENDVVYIKRIIASSLIY